jgi:hypothetical protein
MKTLSEPVTIYNASIPVITRLPILSVQHKNQSDIRTVKGGRRVGLTTLPPSVSRLSRQNVGALTSHNPMGFHGLLQG